MNFFWNDVFEFFRERRRAFLFLGTIFFFLAIAMTGWILRELLGAEKFRQFLQYAVPIAGGLLAGRLLSVVRRMLTPVGRYEPSPLSSDELSKARSKLLTVKK